MFTFFCICLFLIAIAFICMAVWLCYVALYLIVGGIAYLCGLLGDKAWIPIVLLLFFLISMLL